MKCIRGAMTTGITRCVVVAVVSVVCLGALTGCDNNGGRGPALVRITAQGVEFAACLTIDVDRLRVEEDGAQTTFVLVGDVTLDTDAPLAVADPPASIEIRKNDLLLAPGTNIGVDIRDSTGAWITTSIDIPRDGLRDGVWRSWEGDSHGRCADSTGTGS